MSETVAMKVLACNLAEATSEFSKGALAFIYNNNPGWAGERMEIYGRSRSGRWILKWESIHRLENFRFKTVVSESPRFHKPQTQQCVELGGQLQRYDQIEKAYNTHAELSRAKHAAIGA